MWFIHKEFLVGLWWKLRSPNSWSNGLTTKTSLFTSCTSTLWVDVGDTVTIEHTHFLLCLSDNRQAAQMPGFWCVCSAELLLRCGWAKDKLKLSSWSRALGKYALWLAVAICKVLLEPECSGVLPASALNVLWLCISEEMHCLWKANILPCFP